MNLKINLKLESIQPIKLALRMIVGGGIAFILIGFFLSGVGEPNPEWPKYWMIRPLIIVPLSGAMGGCFYHFMVLQFVRESWVKLVAILVSMIVYIVGLWLGSILGLVGTLWN